MLVQVMVISFIVAAGCGLGGLDSRIPVDWMGRLDGVVVVVVHLSGIIVVFGRIMGMGSVRYTDALWEGAYFHLVCWVVCSSWGQQEYTSITWRV